MNQTPPTTPLYDDMKALAEAFRDAAIVTRAFGEALSKLPKRTVADIEKKWRHEARYKRMIARGKKVR